MTSSSCVYEWLDVSALTAQDRFAEHSLETFDAALDLSRTVAERHFAPHNRRNDLEEPTFDGQTVHLHPEIGEALQVFHETGLTSAGMPERVGDAVVARRHDGLFRLVSGSQHQHVGVPLPHRRERQPAVGVRVRTNRSRPTCGPCWKGATTARCAYPNRRRASSLADVAVRAEPQEDGSYRLFEQEMWISGGDCELSENIIHFGAGTGRQCIRRESKG